MLGAAPTKAATLITFLHHAAAALLVIGTLGLALASRSWGTDAAWEPSRAYGWVGISMDNVSRMRATLTVRAWVTGRLQRGATGLP